MEQNIFYTVSELRRIIVVKQSEGKKVVFTNGCFDIIHAGHIKYLTQAKSLGDILIVGLNSDSSVSILKPMRPIVAQKERAIVLASLNMVDYVVIFDEETPYETIKELKPDVLVKGGDWKKQDIVGADLVKEVRSLSYIDGVSTTNIINTIIERYRQRD
ncbi:cytochrome C biogenesis protein CcdA [Candidatus Magnetoovum chiemensis]|nr:cytochrome C biogenesis protein CcdA [Candidatus Magnetoovum chiemensis]